MSDQRSLNQALNVVKALHPEAVRVRLQTSDQDMCGFTVAGVVRADGLELWRGQVDKLEARLDGLLSGLRWNGIVGEDAGGFAEVEIPAFTVGIAEFPRQTMKFTAYVTQEEAESAYDAVDTAAHHVVLFRGAAGYDAPMRDSAVLTRLDLDDPVFTVFEQLGQALRVAGVHAGGLVYDVPDVAERNAVRAMRLQPLLAAYAEATGMADEPAETVVRDILSDLHHLCYLGGHDLGRFVARAGVAFREEVAGEP
jgi:hypothetical protein